MNNNIINPEVNLAEGLRESFKKMITQDPEFSKESPEVINRAVDRSVNNVMKESKIVYMILIKITHDAIQRNIPSIPTVYKFLDEIESGCFSVLDTFRKLHLCEATRTTIKAVIEKGGSDPITINKILNKVMKMSISRDMYVALDVTEEYTLVEHQWRLIDQHEGSPINQNDTRISKWNIPDDIKNVIKKQNPTDLFVLDESMLRKLSTYWISDKDLIDDNGNKSFTIPADILWADTVPIKDMVIELDKNAEVHDTADFRIVDTKSIRFICCSKPTEHNWKTHICLIGIVTMADDSEFVIPFNVTDDESENGDYFGNTISKMPMIGLFKSSQSWYKEYFRENNLLPLLSEICEFAAVYIPVWYGIQVGLLNPVIKEVFDNNCNHKFPIVDHKKDRKGKVKTKIKYIKRVRITDDVFENLVTRSYIRKKLCWYVTGHWRNQATKTGHKRIFIQGYWKGVARETKKGDIRDREMVLNEDYPKFDD